MFKIQNLSNLAVMESGNRRGRGAAVEQTKERRRGEKRRWNRGDLRWSCGGEIGYGSGPEERLAAAVARRRDWRRCEFAAML